MQKLYEIKLSMNELKLLDGNVNVQAQSVINEAKQSAAETNNPVQLVIRDEELQKLRGALTELPYEQRETIVLHLHGDLRFRQIAKLQKVSIKTTFSRYRYGLEKLRSILNGEAKK